MKKLYTLLVVALIAATASAQVVKMDVGANQNRQLPFKGIVKADKGAPAEGWLFYQDYLESYFGEACTDGSAFYLKSDSLGLYEYSDSYGHAFVHSASQTLDFESDFFDYASLSGDISFKHSSSLNVDSICVYTMYLRDEQMPADVMDTLVVGFVADDNAGNYYYTNYPESSCFYLFEYDPNTKVQNNAQVIKIPLGPNDVSEPADEPNSYYLKVFEIPANISNVTAKRWNIAYSFISGENPALDDTLHSSFSLYTFNSNDGAGYAPSSGNPNICDNKSHGGLVVTFSDGEMCDYYYPMFWFDNFNYPKNLGVKISCNDCEIVNVPEIEKNNPTVYPNPATNNFTVNLGNDEKANIQLFNIVGQQVYSETFTGSTNVSVANLHSGVYMLKINQNGKVYTTKVVVK